MPETDGDSIRSLVAAHELGHATVWESAGLSIVDIWVRGHGRRTEGSVEFEKRTLTRGEWRGYVAGLRAGEAAGDLWCDLHRFRYPQHCQWDRAEYWWAMRQPLAEGLTNAEIAALTRRLVRAEWPRIQRLAPRLARRGTVTLPG